jgi:hypothetical protein
MPTDTAPEPDDYDDPYEAHFRRVPLPSAAVDVLVLRVDSAAAAQAVADGLVGLLGGKNRRAAARVVPVDGATGRGPALEAAVGEGTAPLVLVTTATQPWTDAHLAPLLKAIDAADHVVGLRERAPAGRVARWLGRLPWRVLFRVPLHDIHSPCRLHRREALAAIPLQSPSAFADVELLAKATFLGHLLDEVPVPDLPAAPGRSALADVRAVFRKPRFVRAAPASAPAEDAQGDDEGDGRPGGEQGQRPAHVEEPGALQHHPSQGADDLGQR